MDALVLEHGETGASIYTITRERLDALSPAAKKIAQDAINFGLWRLEADVETS